MSGVPSVGPTGSNVIVWGSNDKGQLGVSSEDAADRSRLSSRDSNARRKTATKPKKQTGPTTPATTATATTAAAAPGSTSTRLSSLPSSSASSSSVLPVSSSPPSSSPLAESSKLARSAVGVQSTFLKTPTPLSIVEADRKARRERDTSGGVISIDEEVVEDADEQSHALFAELLGVEDDGGPTTAEPASSEAEDEMKWGSFLPINLRTPAVVAACGAEYSILLYGDGSVLSFGDNSEGQLGVQPQPVSFGLQSGGSSILARGTTPTPSSGLRSSTVSALTASSGVPMTALSASRSTASGAAAIGASLNVSSSGAQSGQRSLLLPQYSSKTVVPTAIGSHLGLSHIIQISCGESHTFALSATGNLYGWGWNRRGQLGLNNRTRQRTPQRVLLDPISAVSCGSAHTLALAVDGQLFSWGFNRHGQLGLGHNKTQLAPQVVTFTSESAPLVSVGCGGNFSICLRSDGTLFSWGLNDDGQLGLGHNEMRNSPQLVPLPDAISFACGLRHTAAITSDGMLYTWGYNFFGQLGTGGSPDSVATSPTLILLPNQQPTVNKVSLSTAASLPRATSPSPLLSSGLGKTVSSLNTPSQRRVLPKPSSGWVAVFCGYHHTLGLTANQTLYGWGCNLKGQLGLHPKARVTTPVQIKKPPSLDTIMSISCGSNHTILILDSAAHVIKSSEQHCDLSRCQLSSLPRGFPSLTALAHLNLSYNNFITFPEELRQLYGTLQTLNLSYNYLENLPTEIGRFEVLQVLDVQHNRLAGIPFEIGDCQNLHTLDVSGNQLASLPYILGKLLSLEKFALKYDDNPLEIPPNVLSDRSALIRYLNEQGKSGLVRWNSVKLVLVGKENVGKTTIRRSFQSKPHDGISTDGVDVEAVTIKDIQFTVYDFGGQQIFYGTHQFFLSIRSLYLIVFDATSIELTNLEFWVRQVGNSSGNMLSPVIFVGTHTDQLTPDGIAAITKQINAKFKHRSQVRVEGCCMVDSRAPSGIVELTNLIVKVAISNGMLRKSVPARWVTLSEKIINARNNMQTMLWGDFVSLASSLDMSVQEARDVAQFLHDVGVIVYWWDAYSSISSLIVIDPHFMAQIMATVITFKPNFVRDGRLQAGALPLLWKNFPLEQHASIVHLLEMYGVLFPLKSQTASSVSSGASALSASEAPYVTEYLVPSLLPDQEPPDLHRVWPSNSPSFLSQWWRVLSFSSLPLGFFPRLLSRVLHMPGATPVICWKNGAVISFPSISTTSPPPIVTSGGNTSVTPPIPLSSSAQVPSASQVVSFSDLAAAPTAAVAAAVAAASAAASAVSSAITNMLGSLTPTSQIVRLDFTAAAGSTYKLNVRVRSAEFFILQQLLHIVDSCITCFYTPIASSVVRNIVCPLCNLSSDGQPTFMFSYDEVIDSLTKGIAIIHCRGPQDRHALLIKDLVPDLSMTSHSVIPNTQIQCDKLLGEGSFGRVWKASWCGRSVAFKELKLEEGEISSKFGELQKEADIMIGLDSPFVLALYGVCLSPPAMVLELAPQGDLNRLLRKTKDSSLEATSDQDYETPLPNPLRVALALDIATGLAYLHSVSPHPIIHRDLRSPNCFLFSLSLNAPVRAKIADFGLSESLLPNTGGVLNTWQWLAPEIIDINSRTYDEKSDVYSLGMVLWEIAARQQPFDELWDRPEFKTAAGDVSAIKAKQAIISSGLRPTIPRSCPFKELMNLCWAHLPSNRPSAAQACKMLREVLEATITQELTVSPEETLPQLYVSSVQVSGSQSSSIPVHLLTTCELYVWCLYSDNTITIMEATQCIPILTTPFQQKRREVVAIAVAAPHSHVIYCLCESGMLYRLEVCNSGGLATQYLKIDESSGSSHPEEEIICSIAFVSSSQRDCVWVGTINGPQNCCLINLRDARSPMGIYDCVTFDTVHPPLCMLQLPTTRENEIPPVWVGTIGCIEVIDTDSHQLKATLGALEIGSGQVVSLDVDKESNTVWCLVSQGPSPKAGLILVFDCITQCVVLQASTLPEPKFLCITPTMQELPSLHQHLLTTKPAKAGWKSALVWCSGAQASIEAFHHSAPQITAASFSRNSIGPTSLKLTVAVPPTPLGTLSTTPEPTPTPPALKVSTSLPPPSTKLNLTGMVHASGLLLCSTTKGITAVTVEKH